jgi:hypothetical protein
MSSAISMVRARFFLLSFDLALEERMIFHIQRVVFWVERFGFKGKLGVFDAELLLFSGGALLLGGGADKGRGEISVVRGFTLETTSP